MEPTEEQKIAALAEISKDDPELRQRLATRIAGHDGSPQPNTAPAVTPLNPVAMMLLVAGADAKLAQYSDGTRQGWPGAAATVELPAEPHPWQGRTVDEVMQTRNAAAVAQYLAKNPNAVAEHCTVQNLFSKGK